MSDRLDDLRRQRERAAEQLAELEREIAAAAAAGGAKPTPTEPVVPPQPAPARVVTPASTPAPTSAKTPPAEDPQTTAAADAILQDYRVEPDAMKSDIKKGCFLYFFGALGFVALVVTVLYFALSKR